jgi:hypothetical protein
MCVCQRCTNPGNQIARATTFPSVARNICGSSGWKLLQVTLLGPGILRWLLDFSKICVPLVYIYNGWEGWQLCISKFIYIK